MSETKDEQIHVMVAMDFSDSIMDMLREVSPRVNIKRHFPTVPDKAWADCEVLYTLNKFPTPEQAPRLRWIQLHTAGMEHAIRQPIVQAEDVMVTSTSGIHAGQMAEYCMAMILAFAYRLPLMLHYQKKPEWPKDAGKIFIPRELRGSTLGIVGYGSIARELARLASTFGMTVLATKRNLKQLEDDENYTEAGLGDPLAEIPDRLYPAEALVSMARECDYLVVTVPLTEQTRHSVDEAVFEAMKPTAVLINVARGAVVDEAALISALAAEKIGGAALDVFEQEPLPITSPLWNFDNVILSPHISGNSAHYHERAARVFAENLTRYVDKHPLLNLLQRERGY